MKVLRTNSGLFVLLAPTDAPFEKTAKVLEAQDYGRTGSSDLKVSVASAESPALTDSLNVDLAL